MIIAMLLAHLMGDYVLQWDALAAWKGRAVKGALFHGSIVLAVTLLFAVLIDPAWWPWALLIGLTHIDHRRELGRIQSALCFTQWPVRPGAPADRSDAAPRGDLGRDYPIGLHHADRDCRARS